MPIKVTLPNGQVVRFPDGTSPDLIQAEIAKLGVPAKDEGFSTGAKVAGGLGLAGLGAMGLKAAKAPGGLVGKAGAFMGQLSALRQQAMLSGGALPKSTLGGIGAAVANSMERGTVAPLRELFRVQTARDIGTGWKAGRQVGPTGAVAANLPKYMDAPGRAIGAVDSAVHKALLRSGLSEEEATRALLQSPLKGGIEESLNNPVMRHVIPFRRTPLNQFMEGGRAIGEHPAISAGYGAAGALQGAAQSDDQYPLTAGYGVAASGKYGLPNAFGQLIGRTLAKGKGGGGIMGSALPVSEYGVGQSILEPLQPFQKPAAVTLLEKLGIVPKRRF